MYAVSLAELEEAAREAGLDPERAVRTNYSGRAMYGAECVGLVHDSQGELIRFTLALARENPDVEEWLTGAGSDAMGRSAITYWPRVQVADAEVTDAAPEEEG